MRHIRKTLSSMTCFVPQGRGVEQGSAKAQGVLILETQYCNDAPELSSLGVVLKKGIYRVAKL